MGLAARRNDLAAASRRKCRVLVAMGMAGRLTKRWSDANEKYLAGNQNASDIAGGLGAVAKVMRMNAAVGGAGRRRLSRDSSGGHRRHHHRRLHPERAGAAPVDLAIAHWKSFVAARQSWHRPHPAARTNAGQARATLLQSPSSRLSVEGVGIVAPGDQKVIRARGHLSRSRPAPAWVDRAERIRASRRWRVRWSRVAAFRGKVRLDGAALDQWSDRRARPVISAICQGSRIVRRNGRAEYLPFDTEAKPEHGPRCREGRRIVHDMIIKMRDGYNTQVGEQGPRCRRSGASAWRWRGRCMAIRSWFVLDEPNSNLDTRGDEAFDARRPFRPRTRRHRRGWAIARSGSRPRHILVPRSRRNGRRASTPHRPRLSRLELGSSSTTRNGSPYSARASATRCADRPTSAVPCSPTWVL